MYKKHIFPLIHNGVKIVIILFCVLAVLIFPKEISNGVKNGLILLGENLIPALFPFMVLSSLAVSAASRVKYPTVRWTVIILLGLLCGLPVGSGAVGRGVDENQSLR